MRPQWIVPHGGLITVDGVARRIVADYSQQLTHGGPLAAQGVAGWDSQWQAGSMADERDRLAAFALRVWGYKQGEVVSLMIHLGDRLGLYRAMTGTGPMTAADLAAATGLQQRWLLEWLRGHAAAG